MNISKIGSNYKLNFTSEIHLISEDRFNKLQSDLGISSKNFIAEPYTVDNVILNEKSGATHNIINCIAGGVRNPSGFLMFHLNPDENLPVIGKVQSELGNYINKLKSKSPDLKGLLVGGFAEDKKSIEFANNLKKIFNEAEVKFSTLLGQKWGGVTNAVYSHPEDTWSINLKHFGKDVLSRSELESLLSDFHIAKGHKLYVRG